VRLALSGLLSLRRVKPVKCPAENVRFFILLLVNYRPVAVSGNTLEQNLYEDRWETFVDDVHFKHRYFNSGADKFLDSVFSLLVTDSSELKPEVVRIIAQGELLYRAHLAQNQKQAEEIIADPAGQFGPTPKYLASSHRMTPNGISALYCALERRTCLSEIRSITGDHVVSAAMTPIGELKLLDLTVLDRVEPRSLPCWIRGSATHCTGRFFWALWSKRCPDPRRATTK
jgi:RES domain